MLHLKTFTFNPFQENTYLLYDDEQRAWIMDPGMSDASEQSTLSSFIKEKALKPERLLLTHAHVDHILGNRYVLDTYGLLPEVHEDDLYFIEKLPQTAAMYGVPCEPSPLPEKYLVDGQQVTLGKYRFECIHAPGHSPGSICFYNAENKILLGGDVLFNGSIGRTDLPRGDHEALLNSIRTRIYSLPDETRVYSGHGPATTVGHEKHNNRFVRA